MHAVLCNDKSDAVAWENMYIEHVVQYKIAFAVIISDRGPQFNTAFTQALALCLGITWNMSVARLPQNNG